MALSGRFVFAPRHSAAVALCFAVAFSLGLEVTGARATAPEPPVNARAVIAADQALPPEGVDELKQVEIGGIKQWIHVRGVNRSNPILLFVHGGPGAPMMPISWTYQRPWEDFFTVVQWDQRGAGKTYASANGKTGKTLGIDLMQADTEELIDYLRKTYGKDKIFLMGHSWGSILGMNVAQHRPDMLYAYIGVGQVINAQRNEVVGYAETLAKAEASGNKPAVAELKAIAPYPNTDGSITFAKISIERKWNAILGGIRYGRDKDDDIGVEMLSPDYSDADVTAYTNGERASEMALVPAFLQVDFDKLTTFKVPVFFFAGAEDRTTPSSIVADYFQHVDAPQKKFFMVEHASHYVVDEAPGEMLVDLVQYVRPLAETSH